MKKNWAVVAIKEGGGYRKKLKIKILKSVTFKMGGNKNKSVTKPKKTAISVLTWWKETHAVHCWQTGILFYICVKLHVFRKCYRFHKHSMKIAVHFSNYFRRYAHLTFIFKRYLRRWCVSLVVYYIYRSNVFRSEWL